MSSIIFSRGIAACLSAKCLASTGIRTIAFEHATELMQHYADDKLHVVGCKHFVPWDAGRKWDRLKVRSFKNISTLHTDPFS